VSTALKVLFLFPNGRPSIANRATLAMVAALPRQGVDAVACFLGVGPLVGVSRDDLGIATLLFGSEEGAVTRRQARRALEPVLRGACGNLVHAVGAAAHLVAGGVARRVGVPAVWSQYDAASLRDLVQLRAALAPSALILAASSVTAERQRRVNPRRCPVEFFPPGVRIPEEAPAARRARARQALGLDEDGFVAGWLAGAGPADTALRAAASLCHARPHARVLLIDDPLLPADPTRLPPIRALAAALGIGDRIGVAPSARGIGPSTALDALDVAFYLPSTVEVVTLAPLESLAAGVAFVAADVPPLREYVTPGRDAVLVPSGDHEALAAALLALADAPEYRARIAAAGLAHVREYFGLEALTTRLVNTYRGLAGRAP